jgi:hypothetical protein
MPDLSDIEDAVAQSALDPAAASVDGQSVTAQDPLKLIAVEKHVAARSATSDGTSAWGKVRMAKAKPPGGGPH